MQYYFTRFVRASGLYRLCQRQCQCYGGEAFYRTLKEMDSPQKLLENISAIPRHATTPDQWQYQILVRIMAEFHIIIVTQHCDHQMIRDMKFDAASTIDEALKKAFDITGRNAKIAVIPDGVSIIAQRA